MGIGENYMKNTNKFFKTLKHIGLFFLQATVILALAACASTSPTSSSSSEDARFMFVHVAEGVKVDEAAKTFRLVGVNQQTLFFSDRPARLAGHLKMADYLAEWTSKAGENNFSAVPPNAALSVYEPGNTDNTLAVVEITNPKIDGSDLIYNYKLIDGSFPAGSGPTTLFIDRIGIGGGVGVGYHGVGVGLRGPGRL